MSVTTEFLAQTGVNTLPIIIGVAAVIAIGVLLLVVGLVRRRGQR
ncbi:MYXO-CTERM sorting domain-containing protein [Compostimonas suwonensis]|uniref:Uncharacterized protein (TIGR03382 family) n=1 Tax=Compostimonas suwonensis TaxID=1048394 RepID=A0A2M9BV49_9MICO|nr:MYXO-CTERM sorting domain-containing protein [Compostimonas suwonensis]PJJ61826.1 uncharacterized protein (TIGR03382 family) [Compostimonas suwonensis]